MFKSADSYRLEGRAGLKVTTVDGEDLLGMSRLVAEALLPMAKAFALEAEILDLGAVHINELTTEDWQKLAAWSKR